MCFVLRMRYSCVQGCSEMFMTPRGDKVSMFTVAYPCKPLRKIKSGHFQLPG